MRADNIRPYDFFLICRILFSTCTGRIHPAKIFSDLPCFPPVPGEYTPRIIFPIKCISHLNRRGGYHPPVFLPSEPNKYAPRKFFPICRVFHLYRANTPHENFFRSAVFFTCTGRIHPAKIFSDLPCFPPVPGKYAPRIIFPIKCISHLNRRGGYHPPVF